jgi:hypothetical protein
MSAHAMGYERSISLACKKFHLAFEMPLPKALWQPVTALPIWFLALHTALSKDPACELIRGASQNCDGGKEKDPLPPPACKV